ANFQEYVDDAGILANGAMTFGAHARIGQDLGDGIFGRRTFLALIGARQMFDVISRVIKTDELYGVCDRLNQIAFFDNGSHVACWQIKKAGRKRPAGILGTGWIYLPVQTGARFSAKAVAPSLASADVKIWAARGRCKSNISAWLQSRDWVTILFAVCTASGPFEAMTRAISSAASSAWPVSTRRLTSP